jgi:glutaconate CoA-transferase, subunit A
MKVLDAGRRELFVGNDVNDARAFYRDKDRAMVPKVMSAKEATERFIADGDYIAVGGFGGVRISTPILHEIVRQGRKGLGYSGHTATHDFQVLSAAESFDRCDIAYIVGLEARGVSRVARKYMESGKVRFTEWTNAGLAWRYRAAAMGVPFVPGRSSLGTDTFVNSAAKVVEDPYSGQKVALFPALHPDVAMIHVHECDIYGNARIRGNIIADDDVGRAAKRVIITTERLIHNDEIRREPDRTVIPFYLVDAVVEAPYGSFPGNMPYEYYSDEDHLHEWLTVEKDPDALKRFMDKFIYGCRDHYEYIERCGGLERMTALRREEFMIHVAQPAGK